MRLSLYLCFLLDILIKSVILPCIQSLHWISLPGAWCLFIDWNKIASLCILHPSTGAPLFIYSLTTCPPRAKQTIGSSAPCTVYTLQNVSANKKADIQQSVCLVPSTIGPYEENAPLPFSLPKAEISSVKSNTSTWVQSRHNERPLQASKKMMAAGWMPR